MPVADPGPRRRRLLVGGVILAVLIAVAPGLGLYVALGAGAG